jgi:hypothetical protein
VRVESVSSTELEDSSSELLESRLLEDCGLDSEEATLLEVKSTFSLEEDCTSLLDKTSSELEDSRATSLEEERSS